MERFAALLPHPSDMSPASEKGKQIPPLAASGREAGSEGPTLLDLFDANVCGRDFAHGKPAPDIFLAAAADLGLPPQRCFVVEDATSGVLAAKAGNMACVGVARLDDAALLRAAGADWVVTNLDELPPAALIG
jgi:beta-phosphoglucomutase-like phosphatase (HAD superfamily)